MSAGEILKDLNPLPDNIAVVTDPEKEERAQTLTEEPTASHALAVAEPEVKGMA